ncbi:glycosyltransferase [Bacillus sp. FJAT-49711]|uniref:glycosyltransferase n=1 Tax=Bacillus sp. FJAT-49711 TaxID=2833585 RepID=UPI001BCA48C5|nr:glycosyltransferase [Bacillus sp. FJAT-49711]MBS4220177.1 glycosyltransferase [Bacillus sp. FJAT-49711]
MKKKILFMLINMNVGGTEKALLNMISEMPRDKFDITIFMLEEYGGFLDSIPSGVRVEYFKGYSNIKELLERPLHVTAIDFLKKGKFIRAFIVLYFYFISGFTKETSLFYKYVLKDYPEIIIDYDIAVAYAGPMDIISYFIAHKVKAKKKIQWIHFDVTKIGFNNYFAAKIYKKFDRIFVVSKEAESKLLNSVPMLKNQTEVFFNIISSEMILKQSKEGQGFPDKFDGIRILTVGRLSIEKGQDLAIRVLAKLIKEGYKVKWYCVGEGNSRKLYEDLIEQYNLSDYFILLGAEANPYTYLKQCDLYVQPSRYEGYCITLMEAKCLKKPIITTKVNGVSEQIRHGETGIIVSFDENEMFDAISRLLTKETLRLEIKQNLKQEIVDNTIEMEKLYRIADRLII